MALLTRRRFIAGLGASAGAAVGGAVYTRFGEPHWLDVDRVEVPRTNGLAGQSRLRIVHLSDFHASPCVSLDFISEAVDRAIAERPDLIALTGDFVTNRIYDGVRYAAILGRLSAAAPTFATLGNHDGGPWTRLAGGLPITDDVRALLAAARIPCLLNASASVTVRGRSVQVIGVGDLWSDMCDPATAFGGAPARGTATRVLLNHNPDAKVGLRNFDWDLVLCGHTHGGQIRLPLIGTPFAPVVDKRFVEGLHHWENRWLYVTRGVGNLHGVRFNCRPQVSVIEIL